MEKLRAAVRRLAPPKDRSYRDPYALVIKLAADRTGYGVWGLAFLVAGVVMALVGTIPLFERFRPEWEVVFVVGLSSGCWAGLFLGLWAAATLCQESLNSVIPIKQAADDPG